MNQIKRIFIITLLSLSASSLGATSFFAKNLMRSLFDIEIAKESLLKEEVNPVSSSSLPFKLLVWNIYKGDLFKKSPLPVNFQDYQLILFQEFSQGIPKSFLPQKSLYFLPTFKWENHYTGVAIYSQGKLDEVTPLHTKYREPFIITPKASIIFDYQGITIINTHALNFVSEEEWIFELNELSQFIKNKDKVIWAGDFNTWSSERTQYLLSHMSKLDLQEVKFKNDKRTRHLGFPVDFIFIKGLDYSDQNTTEAGDHSDHNPLYITIQSKVN